MGLQCTNVTLAHHVTMDKERNRCKRRLLRILRKDEASSEESISVTAESSRCKCEKDATTDKSGCFDNELSSSGSTEVIPPILVVTRMKIKSARNAECMIVQF